MAVCFARCSLTDVPLKLMLCWSATPVRVTVMSSLLSFGGKRSVNAVTPPLVMPSHPSRLRIRVVRVVGKKSSANILRWLSPMPVRLRLRSRLSSFGARHPRASRKRCGSPKSQPATFRRNQVRWVSRGMVRTNSSITSCGAPLANAQRMNAWANALRSWRFVAPYRSCSRSGSASRSRAARLFKMRPLSSASVARALRTSQRSHWSPASTIANGNALSRAVFAASPTPAR
mmetsp:Transcript_65577/g.200843  ORF Transcript_65577/g.200843 Transcript_65577/m.200843 type:complete len:231 (+) Transcript_65577:187-879(+)